MVLKWKWFIICLLFIGCFNFGCPRSIAAQSEDFPIGLELEYIYVSGGGDSDVMRYNILRWAPEVGVNIVEIEVVTATPPTNDIVFVSTVTWQEYLPNGTSTGNDFDYPLWLDTSNWESSDTISIPTSTRSFDLMQQSRGFIAGAYHCWLADWVELYSTYLYAEEWNFEVQSGVFLRYYEEYMYSDSPNWETTLELAASNLAQFGIYSLEMIQFDTGLHIAPPVLVFLIIILGFYYSRRRRKDSRRRQASRPLISEQPLPSPVEGHAREPSHSPSVEKEALSPCIVCRLPIKPGSAVLGCPHCGGFAHRRHLLEWIKVKGRCPYCHKKVKESQLTHIDL